VLNNRGFNVQCDINPFLGYMNILSLKKKVVSMRSRLITALLLQI